MDKAGLYIHIPFCVRKCPYCDFYSVGYDAGCAARYVDAVCAQMRLAPHVAIDSIYFGGGTPSLLDSSLVAQMLDAAAGVFAVSSDCEVTLEMNPATGSAAKLTALRAAGVNRLSIGVQSTDDGTLRKIGRLHDRAGALETIALAARQGFANISADVMLALPGEDFALLAGTLDALCALPITHLSAYLLKIMPGTPFAAHRPDGIPDDDAQADIYERACLLLAQKGFAQYEISNFARGAQYRSRHNLKYWRCAPYYGLGAAAHSSIGGRLYSFAPDIARYIEVFGAAEGSAGAAGSDAAFCAPLKAEGEIGAAEYIMLALRTVEGLDLDALKARFGFAFDDTARTKLDAYARAGLCSLDAGTVTLTRKGMLVSNAILAEII